MFSKVTNCYHQSIPAGIEAIKKLGREHRFEVVVNDDPAEFTMGAFFKSHPRSRS